MTEAIKTAISALRQIVDSLESALSLAQHGSARSPVLKPSEPSEWDVVSQAESAGQPTENRGLDLCNRETSQDQNK